MYRYTVEGNEDHAGTGNGLGPFVLKSELRSDVLPVGTPILKRVAPIALESARTWMCLPDCDRRDHEDDEEHDHGRE